MPSTPICMTALYKLAIQWPINWSVDRSESVRQVYEGLLSATYLGSTESIIIRDSEVTQVILCFSGYLCHAYYFISWFNWRTLSFWLSFKGPSTPAWSESTTAILCESDWLACTQIPVGKIRQPSIPAWLFTRAWSPTLELSNTKLAMPRPAPILLVGFEILTVHNIHCRLRIEETKLEIRMQFSRRPQDSDAFDSLWVYECREERTKAPTYTTDPCVVFDHYMLYAGVE